MYPQGKRTYSGNVPEGGSGISRPNHFVYRVIEGVYEDTPCWCKDTHNHYLGQEL